jgi:hypothetical protein
MLVQIDNVNKPEKEVNEIAVDNMYLRTSKNINDFNTEPEKAEIRDKVVGITLELEMWLELVDSLESKFRVLVEVWYGWKG